MPDKCPVCGGISFKRVVGRAGWNIWACRSCTNAFTFPVPKNDLQYDDHRFFQISTKDETRWRQGAAELIRFMKDNGCRGTLLDIGFGNGFLIDAALLAGFDAQGIEASHSAVVVARQRGLRVSEGYLQQNSFPECFFDIVVMNHVLEHSADPPGMLKVANSLIKPGGFLVLGQTNYLGTVVRLLRSRWYAWVPSEHYTHFSIKGVVFLLENGGFRKETIWRVPLFWDWIMFSKTSVVRWPGVLLNNLAVMATRGKIGLPFMEDGFFVLARKLESSSDFRGFK